MTNKELVLKLRKKTGMGMLDCKKALEESQGDFPKAMEIMVKKGRKIAHKKLGREIEQGVIFSKINPAGNVGVLLALGCETDFVARNELLAQLANRIMDMALIQKPADKETLLVAKQGDGPSVKDQIMEQIGAMGENMEIAEYYLLEASFLGTYIHTGGKLGAMVALNQGGTTQLQKVARDMALHVVAMNPLAIDEKSMDADILSSQRALINQELQGQDKPQAIKDKIATGKMKKFIQTQTILAQPFVKDENITCQAYLQQVDKDLAIVDYKRIAIDG